MKVQGCLETGIPIEVKGALKRRSLFKYMNVLLPSQVQGCLETEISVKYRDALNKDPCQSRKVP